MNLIEKFLEHERTRGLREETIKSCKQILMQYKTYIAQNFHKRLDQVSSREIETYLEYLMNRHLAKSTIQTRMVKLRIFYGFCHKEDIILINPMDGLDFFVKRDRLPRFVPDEKTVDIFLSFPDEYTYQGILEKAVFEMMYTTGIRRSELMALKVSDIDMRENMVFIREGKGGRQRIVPVGDKAMECVRKYLEVTRRARLRNSSENHLFLAKWGKALSKSEVARMFQRHKDKSKFTMKMTPHSLRHACAVHMLRGGASIIMVSKMLGHKTLKTTQVYTRLCPEDLKTSHRKHHPRQ